LLRLCVLPFSRSCLLACIPYALTLFLRRVSFISVGECVGEARVKSTPSFFYPRCLLTTPEILSAVSSSSVFLGFLSYLNMTLVFVKMISPPLSSFCGFVMGSCLAFFGKPLCFPLFSALEGSHTNPPFSFLPCVDCIWRKSDSSGLGWFLLEFFLIGLVFAGRPWPFCLFPFPISWEHGLIFSPPTIVCWSFFWEPPFLHTSFCFFSTPPVFPTRCFPVKNFLAPGPPLCEKATETEFCRPFRSNILLPQASQLGPPPPKPLFYGHCVFFC